MSFQLEVIYWIISQTALQYREAHCCSAFNEIDFVLWLSKVCQALQVINYTHDILDSPSELALLPETKGQ